MAAFVMAIAGHRVAVTSLFESTRDYCARYLCAGEPEFAVAVSWEDLVHEQAALDREAVEEGLRLRRFSDPFLERTAIQRRVAEQLLTRDVLLLHGSLVAVDGAGYLFTARCGTGKSTHTRLWRQVFGSRALMINDDKPFLSLEGSRVMAWGAPWSGKHGLDTNTCVPLKGICILERGERNEIRPASAAEALPMLLHQSTWPREEGEQARVEVLNRRLAEQVALWHMRCNREPEAAAVAWEAMHEAP